MKKMKKWEGRQKEIEALNTFRTLPSPNRTPLAPQSTPRPSLDADISFFSKLKDRNPFTQRTNSLHTNKQTNDTTIDLIPSRPPPTPELSEWINKAMPMTIRNKDPKPRVLTEDERLKIVWAIMWLQGFDSLLYALQTPFLPLLATNKGVPIGFVGYIFGTMAVMIIIT